MRVMKNLKRAIRKLCRNERWVIFGAIAAVIIASGILIERSFVNADYTNLLSTIAEGESRGNYNAYFGNVGNTKIRFTEMSLGDVLAWQERYVAEGSPSGAVGRYQFIGPTLRGLVDEMNIDRQTIFDETLQDRLAVRLLVRRGVREYLRGRISREQLAHNLSKEWAALPKVIGDNPAASYYAGDGLNKAHVKTEQVLAVIDNLKITRDS